MSEGCELVGMQFSVKDPSILLGLRDAKKLHGRDAQFFECIKSKLDL